MNKLFEETKIQLPGFNIAIKSWGNKSATPILCLHGKMDNAASFDLIAPLLPDFHIVAIDFPGNGFSSHYLEGVLPHWKNDAFLLLQLIKHLKWKQFAIIAHSQGALAANILTLAIPEQITQLIFLDILGPTVNFIENAIPYLHSSLETFLSNNKRIVFPDLESAIQDRMKIGNISFQAASALVTRGMKECDGGWAWTFDQRLRCVSSTVPYEDEIQIMLNNLTLPTHLIRASQGVPYPAEVFESRVNAIKDLTIHKVDGGHHVHMDEPQQVASVLRQIITN